MLSEIDVDVPAPPADRNALERPPEGFDLLRIPPVRALIRWSGFPYIFQVVMLAAFTALAIVAWGRFAPAGINDKLFAKLNLATLVIWGLWWPAMVWIAVLLGRAWCMVCPLELVSNLSERAGRWLGIRQWHLHPWLTSGAIIVVLYATVQFLVAGVKLHRVPAYTAVFLLVLLVGAVVTGLLFKHRAFCRGFCPVGLLLGTFGRGGILAVRPQSRHTCQTCTGKDCITDNNRTKSDGRSCPSLLDPRKLHSNRDCLVCGQCIKVCEPANVRLVLRRPFSARDAREASASWPVTIFVMLLCGFVLWELTTEWPKAQEVFLTIPTWFGCRVGASGLQGWLNGAWALLVVPIVLWSILAGIARLLGADGGVTAIWRRLALPIAVIVAAGQMAKGLAKFVTWVGFLPVALGDPTGSHSATAALAHSLTLPGRWLTAGTVSAVGTILIALSLLYGIRELKLASNRLQLGEAAALVVLTMLFLPIIIGWAWAGG